MGTNFYKMDGTHIGKRSAAGKYCWDCGMTLRIGGESRVHYTDSHIRPIPENDMDDIYNYMELRKQEHLKEWYEKCPKCGKYPDEKGANAMFKELGFSKVNGKQIGVSSCCSFTWATHPDKLKRIRFVKDEYGRKYTAEQFDKELEFCPIQFFDSIGKEFS